MLFIFKIHWQPEENQNINMLRFKSHSNSSQIAYSLKKFERYSKGSYLYYRDSFKYCNWKILS